MDDWIRPHMETASRITWVIGLAVGCLVGCDSTPSTVADAGLVDVPPADLGAAGDVAGTTDVGGGDRDASTDLGTVEVCVAPAAACEGRCVDLRSDARHCGACGNACTGGTTCRDGVCCDANDGGCTVTLPMPEELTSSPGPIGQLRIDGDTLYFSARAMDDAGTRSAFFRMPTSGGPPTSFYAPPRASGTAWTVTRERLWVVESDDVAVLRTVLRSVPVSGGAATDVVAIDGLGDSPTATPSGILYLRNLADGNRVELVGYDGVRASLSLAGEQFDYGDGYVYHTAAVGSTGPWDIQRTPLAGGTTERVARRPDCTFVSFVRVAGPRVFWIEHESCPGSAATIRLMAAPVAGGTPVEVSSESAAMTEYSSLVAAGDELFYAVRSPGVSSVRRVRPGSVTSEPVAVGQSNRVVSIAADARSIYWSGCTMGIECLNGFLRRVAR